MANLVLPLLTCRSLFFCNRLIAAAEGWLNC